jgi:hypothetical protein
MNRTLIAVFICGFVSSVSLAQKKPCQPTKHAKVPAIAKATYHTARKRLLAAGWQPVPRESFRETNPDPSIAYGNGPIFQKTGYVEVEACSGTGVAACSFLFKDAYGNRLRITTAGEELPEQKSYAKVTSFRFVCD